jgi:hypothetical protein
LWVAARKVTRALHIDGEQLRLTYPAIPLRNVAAGLAILRG